MNYMESVTKAIAYIEDHLCGKISAEVIAELVGYSSYHFQRMFQLVTRNTVMEYVRGRRLTRAAYDLFHSDVRLVEIAFKYRFESQEAFTRAFQNRFSISPGRFRKQADMKNTLFRAMERKALDEAGLRHLHYGVSLSPEYIAMDRLLLAGMEVEGLNSQEIGKMWRCFRQRVEEIDGREDSEPIFYSVIELTGNQWGVSYTACVEVSEEGQLPEGMVYKSLAPTTYAVFSHRGSLARISDTFQYIYSTWLPKSGKTRANAPELARYDHRYLGPDHEDSEFDIYIPVSSIV